MNLRLTILVALPLLISCSTASAQKLTADVPYVKNGHERHVLDIYTREAAAESKTDSLPVMFWIHGGGWQVGDKSDVALKPKVLTDRGFVFVSTNYRLLPDVTMDVLIRDVATSLGWVHRNIAKYGGDPQRIFVGGHSAGAQLAALICIDDRYLKAQNVSFDVLRGCVPVDGDTYDIPKIIMTAEFRQSLYGGKMFTFGHRQKFGNDPEKHADFSAVTHVAKGKGIPPFLILYFPGNPNTRAQAGRLASVLKESGIPVTSYGKRDSNHSRLNNDLGKPDDPATEQFFSFLDSNVRRNGARAMNDKQDAPAELAADNPFASPSKLALQAPLFDDIRVEHYMPAYMTGIKQQLAEIKAIANQSAAPTFENTIVPFEESGALLSRTEQVFSNLTSANTNEHLQNIQTELAPLLAAHSDNILLNRQLFERVKQLYDSRKRLTLTPEQQQVLKRHYENFVRAGAQLPEQQQNRIRSLNEQLSTLQTEFRNNLLAATKERSVIVDDVAELDGLSAGQIAAAAEKAKERGSDGRYVLEITNTTRVPILKSLNNRALRQRVWEASANRAIGQNGGVDNRGLVLEIAQLRAERARLLGFDNHAAYKLQNQMAKTPEAARRMLTDLVPGVVARVNEEADDLRAMMKQLGANHELAPWDWEYYAEKVRKARFDVDESEVKPYFEMNNVLEKGVFFTMQKLFGVTFRERRDLPVYHREVRVFDVLDADGSQVGLFYIDFFSRDSKRGGAWMSSYVRQSHLLGHKPVIVNVLNNPKPAEGEPALISFDNVTTMFHEMGHAVHGLFSDVTYPSVAGTATPRDFVEFPSTFEEDWAVQPDILRNYARHHETGEPIPAELLTKVIQASKFNQGFDTLEYLAAAILDLEWHTLSADEIPDDIEAFEAATLKKYEIDIAAVPPRYRTAYFAHIWGSGYSAAYYAYIWSEVLAADAFAHMMSRGGATRENGARFRQEVLSRGSSRDPMDSYTTWRGTKPTIDALLIRRGLK